jgi:hypothetical protein
MASLRRLVGDGDGRGAASQSEVVTCSSTPAMERPGPDTAQRHRVRQLPAHPLADWCDHKPGRGTIGAELCAPSLGGADLELFQPTGVSSTCTISPR